MDKNSTVENESLDDIKEESFSEEEDNPEAVVQSAQKILPDEHHARSPRQISGSLESSLQKRDPCPKRRTRQNYGKGPYECKFCLKIYPSGQIRQFRSHIYEHRCKLDNKHFKCKHDGCTKTFTWKRYMERHYREVHLNERNFKCEVCNFTTSYKQYLKYHVQRVHEKVREQKCDFCCKSFFRFADLQTHVRSHIGDRLYPCELCSKRFFTKDNMKSHAKAMHSTEKSLICEVCGKAYRTEGTFYHHKLTHKEREHVCEVCGKKFCSFSKLKNHLIVHTKEKRYSCEVCGKAFSYLRTMKIHLRLHTNENIVCQICRKGFNSHSHLTTHMKSH